MRRDFFSMRGRTSILIKDQLKKNYGDFGFAFLAGEIVRFVDSSGTLARRDLRNVIKLFFFNCHERTVATLLV